jgi:endonuclease/exonuclease/phosphatase family metal-dependent hydrolase
MEYYEGQDLHQMSELEWRELSLAQLQKKQKPLAKVWGLSKAILDIDPDILMLVEVGGKESLENFNQYFLKDQFQTCFLEGNSKRNIDLGFLIKKNLPFRVEALSNKETPIEVNSYQRRYISKFSRDVGELRLYEGDQLKFIVLLVHLKSMISTEQDFKGKDVRTAEAIALAGIYSKLRADFPKVPIVLGGDFNTSLATLELELLARTDLVDFHDLLNTPEEKRVSLVHFDYLERPHLLILDYLLISPHLKNRIIDSESYTYRYKGFYEIPENLPKTPKDRYQMPSDHYPLVLTIDLKSGI